MEAYWLAARSETNDPYEYRIFKHIVRKRRVQN